MHISPNDLACSTHHGEAESDRCLLPIVILVRLVDGDHAVRCPDAVLLVVVHHSFDAGRPVVEKLAHGITLGSHHERRRENERSRVSRTELLLEMPREHESLGSRVRLPEQAIHAPPVDRAIAVHPASARAAARTTLLRLDQLSTDRTRRRRVSVGSYAGAHYLPSSLSFAMPLGVNFGPPRVSAT